jgi:hypothetical protein
MPDLDLLPRGHALHPGPRPPAGLGEVLTRATRRRRRQQASALATGAAACAAVFAFTMASGGAVDSLGVTPAHRPDGDAPAVTAPQRGGSLEVVEPALPAQTTDRNDALRSDDSATGTTDAQTSGIANDATTTAQRPNPGSEVGPPHTMTAFDPSRGCSGWGSNAAEGWCGYYDGATSGPAGKRVELAETVCRLPNRGTGTLLSDTGQQAEFSVHSQDAYTMWTWSTGHRFSKRGTSITVPAGSCVRWHVSWTVVDGKGRPLAAGAYNLSPKPWTHPSQAAAPASVWADANVVTFTVTG